MYFGISRDRPCSWKSVATGTVCATAEQSNHQNKILDGVCLLCLTPAVLYLLKTDTYTLVKSEQQSE